MATLSYMTVGSNNLEQAKTFYDGLLGSIGWAKAFEHPSGGRIYSGPGGALFGVLGPHDGKAASVGNGSMGGFSFDKQEDVAAFHAKAMALGGSDEGAPGERGPGIYFAYFRDPEGNKLCAYKMG